jgi:CHAT domain-containing protein
LLLDNIYENKFDRDFGKLYHTWGRSKLAAGDAQSALELFQRSLKSMLPLFKAENPLQNPEVKELYGENTLMDALLGKALALDQLYDQSQNIALLKAALEAHERIFEVERLLRQSYYYEDSKLYNVEDSRQRCGHAIKLCMQLAKTDNESHYYEKAFELAEKSKSVLLLEAFLQNNVIGMSLPPELQAEEQAFQKTILDQEKLLHQLEMARGRDSLKIQQARETLLSHKKIYADWKKSIQKSHGQYYNNRYNDQPISVELVQQDLLKSDETLLEYFVGDEVIYLFVVNRKRFKVLQIPKPENFESDVMSMLASIQGFTNTQDADELCREYTRLAQQFYDLLLSEPAMTGLLKQNILVVPSGILAYLPFDVLLTGVPDQDCQFNQYPYALYDYNFYYGYSATLHEQLGAMSSRSPGNFLAVAPRFSGTNGWGALQANVDLVEALKATWKGIYAINDSATISRLEKSLAQETFEVVHFSTHAEANMDRADFSFIVFADGAGHYDSLFVKDIYQLRLLSEMVVLGACETATGSLHDGEGVISLARAFLQIGSRSVITTLWSVYDGTNQNVMLDFYANLQSGMTKSESLQNAKIAQTQLDARSAHPVFWAAYVPYGQMEAIRKTRPLWVYGVALIVMAGLVAIFSRRLQNRRRRKAAIA